LKVLIADDHATVRAGLRVILESMSEVELTGEVSRLEDLDATLESLPTDLLLLDFRFGHGVSLDHLPRLKAKFPRTQVLMLSMYQEGTLVLRALQAGARGFVNKESADTVLLEALKAVGEGHVYLDQLSLDALAGQLVQIPDGAIDSQKGLGLLTAREHEVFALLLAGQSVKSIAFQLGISPKTADNHKAAVYTKLKVSGPVELVQFAQAHPLI
jgi:DNA-binding NarL/FixJ family response regulator